MRGAVGGGVGRPDWKGKAEIAADARKRSATCPYGRTSALFVLGQVRTGRLRGYASVDYAAQLRYLISAANFSAAIGGDAENIRGFLKRSER